MILVSPRRNLAALRCTNEDYPAGMDIHNGVELIPGLQMKRGAERKEKKKKD